MAGMAAGLMLALPAARGGDRVIEDFGKGAAARWAFISDQVMGGVSTGRVSLERDGAQTVLHLRGTVSTENRGGFIQARRKLSDRLPADAQGLEMWVRGNGQRYYVHARTKGTVLPWNFYQAPFEVTAGWSVVRIPFAAFEAQGRMLRKELRAGAVTSLAIVAYGRDHEADVRVARIGLY